MNSTRTLLVTLTASGLLVGAAATAGLLTAGTASAAGSAPAATTPTPGPSPSSRARDPVAGAVQVRSAAPAGTADRASVARAAADCGRRARARCCTASS